MGIQSGISSNMTEVQSTQKMLQINTRSALNILDITKIGNKDLKPFQQYFSSQKLQNKESSVLYKENRSQTINHMGLGNIQRRLRM